MNSKSFFVKSYGCQMNVYDSEKIASILENKGMIEKEEIVIKLTPSKDNLADFLTKETASSEKLLRVLAGDETIPWID